MEVKKVLIVVSNHPPDNWSEDQKSGWDVIEFIKHPDIPPEIDYEKLYFNYTKPLIKSMCEIYSKYYISTDAEIYACVQGDYSFCYQVYKYSPSHIKFVFPTTKREVKEEKLPDGSIKKTQIFKFVRWR